MPVQTGIQQCLKSATPQENYFPNTFRSLSMISGF
jgi:hypothetical protein